MNPWVIIGVILLALGLGITGELHGRREQRITDQHEIDQQKIEAGELRFKLQDAARQKESDDAKYTRDLDAAHADAARAATDATDAARPRIDGLVRSLAGCRRSSSGSVPTAPTGSSSSADSAAGSDDRLLGGIGERFTRLGEAANKLAALVRTECVPWANRVGR